MSQIRTQGGTCACFHAFFQRVKEARRLFTYKYAIFAHRVPPVRILEVVYKRNENPPINGVNMTQSIKVQRHIAPSKGSL